MPRADEEKARIFHQKAVDKHPDAKDGDPKLVRWSFTPDHIAQSHFIQGIIDQSGDPDRILEAGSGWGEIAYLLSMKFPMTEYLGVELFDRFVSYAKKAYEGQNLRFEKGSFWDALANAQPGQYDWLISIGCLFEVVEPCNWERLWRLIWRASRGLILIFDYRRPVPDREWFESHLEEWGATCPNFKGKYNLKIRDVREMTGWKAREVKLCTFIFGRCVYFAKGEVEPWDGEIPEYVDPADFKVLGS